MRWEGNRESANVEDDRGSSGGGGGGFGFGGRSIGLGSVVIALVAGWIFGVNPLTILGLLSGGGGGAPMTQSQPQQPNRPPPSKANEDPSVRFVRVVLASTEDTWAAQFQAMGRSYQPARLILYRNSFPTACGQGSAAMGPFYCPGDQKVYLDLGFFDTMRSRLGAPGEFAQAYVVAHEVGHHVQDLLGVTGKVDAMRGRLSEAQQNALSVRVELQADCFAGIWAHDSQQSKRWLDQTDIDSALNAASQIGDDTLQRKARGQVVPETFTHGTSAQRVAWFKRGLQNGQVRDCDTFQNRQ